MRKSFKLICASLILLGFGSDANAMECGWYFNWYCPGCRHIGAPTSGKGGPYSSRSSCESARSSARQRSDKMGGGTDFGVCYQSGYCKETTPSSPSKPYSSPDKGSEVPAYQGEQPQYDYEKERIIEEERQRKAEEERKKQEQEAKEKFEKDKKGALEIMKSVDADTKSLKGVPSGSLGLKGLPPEAPKLKEVSASSWISAVKDEKNPCPGGLTSLTYLCGGGSNWPYVCCPRGAPYLNHCDCKCYSSSDFDCKSYSKCEPR